ncbi:hypothetical protein C9426_28170 [Serratia sp. S1B]|nr:hypothetical protein C9426_28170 [Serratia sp. S1B]
MKNTKEKNQDIQVVRAIAIGMVIVQHARNRLPTPSWYHEIFSHAAFWSGVDIFLAISGFLICKTFLRDLRLGSNKRIAMKNFWIRRLGRLYPALFFWSLVSIAISFFTQSVDFAIPEKIAKSAFTALLGVSNIYWVECFQTGQIMVSCGSPDFNGVTWSLSLEWQLYALTTLLLFYLGKIRALLVMLCLAVLMSFFSAPSFSYMWALRLQAFTLGALIYIFADKQKEFNIGEFNPWIARFMCAAGCTICIISPVKLPQPFLIPVLAIGASLCLLSSLSGTAYSRTAISKGLAWIGERSYSIYLCHLPMILIAREITARTVGLNVTFWSVIFATTLALILILATANMSYLLIELPFQRITWKKNN